MFITVRYFEPFERYKNVIGQNQAADCTAVKKLINQNALNQNADAS